MKNMGEITEGVLLTSEDQLDGDSAEELASFIDDMNAEQHAETQISVLRIPTDARGTPLPNSKHMGQLFTELLGRSTVNDVIERIRRDFIRPGETSITVRIIGKKPGERRLLFNRIYTIEKPETTNKAPESSTAEMLRLMREHADAQAQRTENFMREMLQMQRTTQVVPAESITDQLVKLAPILTPLITGLLGRPVPAAGGGASELLATVKVLKEVNGVFGGGNSDDGNSTMETIKAVAGAIGPGLKFLAARAETEKLTVAERMRRLPPPAPPASPAVTPVTPPRAKPAPNKTPAAKVAPAPNNNSEGEDVNLKDLREKMQLVATMCDEGQTAEAVAELIVDSIEDDELEELYNRVQPENFVSQMAVLAPSAVRGREAWFGKLRLAILDQYESDPDATEGTDVPALNGGSESADDLGADPVDVDSIPDATN